MNLTKLPDGSWSDLRDIRHIIRDGNDTVIHWRDGTRMRLPKRNCADEIAALIRSLEPPHEPE